MSLWQRIHILNELGYSGFQFDEIDPADYTNMDEVIEVLKLRIRSGKIDLFFTGYGESYLNEELLSELKLKGIPSILFCSDNLLDPFEHLNISRYFDLVWLTSRETEYLFSNMGAKTIILPYAANPNIYRGLKTENINKALFIGSPYGSRANIINKLASNRIEIDLYTDIDNKYTHANYIEKIINRFPKKIRSFSNLLKFQVGRKVLLAALKQKISGSAGVASSPYINRYSGISFDSMYEAYGRYAVSLSSTAARNTGVLQNPVNVINLRSFEIPMSGGVQLCAFSNELAEYFEDGREIVFYYSDDELIEKASYLTSARSANYLSNIRKCARERALRDHTWAKRFRAVFSRLGIAHKALLS